MFFSYCLFAQEQASRKVYVGVSISPVNSAINADELTHNPFGEYGLDYVVSNDFGIEVGYHFAPRSTVSLGISNHNYELDFSSQNPFPSFVEDEVIGEESIRVVSSYVLGLTTKYSFLSKGKVSIYGLGGVKAAMPYKNKQSITTELFSLEGNYTKQSEVEVKIQKEQLSWFLAGVGFEYKLLPSVLASFGVNVNAGKIVFPPFGDDTGGILKLNRKEFSFPIGLGWLF